jgi:TetR/AcrR family transcriptional regulator, regulator of autoinduction and epiphytic fitness
MVVNIVDDTQQKRRYHSPQRQQQAQDTRHKLLDAARRLFAAQGYAATTLPAIAREAELSPATVTAVFGTKARLLNDLIHLMVRGDAESSPLAQRPWWQAMLSEPDPRRQLTLHATNVWHIHERSADVAEIVRGAATADPEIAAMLRQLAGARLTDAQMVAQSLDEKQALAADVTVERAADLLWALCSHDLYRMLVVEQHWPPEDYAHWLASSLIHSLVDHHATG